MFRYAYEKELLQVPVRFGHGFQRPSKKTLRLHRAKQGPKLFTAKEVRALIGGVLIVGPNGPELVEVNVKPGDTVQEGQVIARLDDRMAAAEVGIRETKLSVTRADLDASEKTRTESRERYLTLLTFAKRSATDPEDVRVAKLLLDRYEADVLSKRETVKVPEQELEQAKILLDDYVVRSPATGQVRVVTRHRGEGLRQPGSVVVLLTTRGSTAGRRSPGRPK